MVSASGIAQKEREQIHHRGHCPAESEDHVVLARLHVV